MENLDKLDTSWSQLLRGDNMMAWEVARLMSDPRRKYHNLGHVRRLYQHAKSYQVPYDINLDAAILWHDAVYDEHPDKELRSIEVMRAACRENPDWFEDIDLPATSEMILNTIEHVYCNEHVNPWMIRLDVVDLADPDQRYENFWLLLEEARELYGIDAAQAAQGTVDFMNSFKDVMDHNAINDYEFDGTWQEIAAGCEDTLLMARTICDLYTRGL